VSNGAGGPAGACERAPRRERLRGALTDIADDAPRAAQVIRRLRALLRKEWTEPKAVDVTADLEVMTCCTATWTTRHRPRVLAGQGPAAVLSDAIQLQQVILNVVINAAEAMAGASPGRAYATIETAERHPARSRSPSAMAAPRERGRLDRISSRS